ncbi:hypothetical protein [Paractinoplanes maris]|uniref:CdiA C-terminal domain-containing protein n=1 Tax=Paractinoplanes maris TaxID=1734446 RepID=UPI003F68BE64
MREGQDFTSGVARAGRAGSATTQSDGLVTRRTGMSGGAPQGRPTEIPRRDDREVQRSLEMENSGAVVLAGNGWRIKQNPSPEEVAQARAASGDHGHPSKNPDYLLEGRVFDAYSPTNPEKSPRGVWRQVEEGKIEAGQTQRVVINLEDWRGDLSALQRQFADWPMPGLKEVKVITADGDIIQFDLPPYTERGA